jgi:hypothetical protein
LREKLDEMGLLQLDHGDEEHYEAAPLDEDEVPTMPRTLPSREPEAALEPPPETDIAAPGIEPTPVGRRKSRAKDKAPPEPSGDGEEDIEDWKRKLLQLTGEGDEGQE